jgi:hypothetical protein
VRSLLGAGSGGKTLFQLSLLQGELVRVRCEDRFLDLRVLTADVGGSFGFSASYTASHALRWYAAAFFFAVRSSDDDEPEVYYAQLMYLVPSEGGRALTQNREASPAVDRVNQPRADIVAQMGM